MQSVKYKAEFLWKKTEHIDARYTSQKCSACGRVKRSQREGLSFRCSKCGFKLHTEATSLSSRAFSITPTSQLVQISGR